MESGILIIKSTVTVTVHCRTVPLPVKQRVQFDWYANTLLSWSNGGQAAILTVGSGAPGPGQGRWGSLQDVNV
jgi:hypothetical protein